MKRVFAILLLGAFIPYQVFIYPLVRVFSAVGLYNTLACIVTIHIVFGLPILLQQLWLFVVPAIHPKTRRMVYAFIFPSLVLALAGIAFAHFLVTALVSDWRKAEGGLLFDGVGADVGGHEDDRIAEIDLAVPRTPGRR